MGYFSWDPDKNERLKSERGITFEQIVSHIEKGHVLQDDGHPNQAKYSKQRMYIVNVNGYAYLVPYVQTEGGRFLKTIIPSRKATRDFLGGRNEEDQAR